jgi:hypothetical protein
MHGSALFLEAGSGSALKWKAGDPVPQPCIVGTEKKFHVFFPFFCKNLLRVQLDGVDCVRQVIDFESL